MTTRPLVELLVASARAYDALPATSHERREAVMRAAETTVEQFLAPIHAEVAELRRVNKLWEETVDSLNRQKP